MDSTDDDDVVSLPPQATRFQALRRGRCPRCRAGRIFAGSLRMHETCPVCHLGFNREPGYFVGAMYVSYGLAVAIIAALTVVLSYEVLPQWPLEWVVLAATAVFLPLVPAVFRYSRIVWIHVDRYVDPADEAAQRTSSGHRT